MKNNNLQVIKFAKQEALTKYNQKQILFISLMLKNMI